MLSAPIANYRVAGGLVFTAGQIGVEPDGSCPSSFRRQAELALRSLERCLEEAGSSIGNVVRATVYLDSREHFAVMNEVYSEFFREPWPSRTTIICGLALPELQFEIDAVALLAGSEGATASA